MCKRSSMKSLLSVFWLGNAVIFARGQLWPWFDLLFWPVHFCHYHSFLEMLFLNNGFSKNCKRNAGYLNPFPSDGPFLFVLMPRLQAFKTQLFWLTRVYINISFHFSCPSFTSFLPDLEVSDKNIFSTSVLCPPWVKGAVFCPISGCRCKSPCSFEHSLSRLASFVNLMSILAWRVSFGFADYCKHVGKLKTQFSIYAHLHLCLLVFFSDLTEILPRYLSWDFSGYFKNMSG